MGDGASLNPYRFFIVMQVNIIHLGNCLTILKTLPNDSIDCCITSPPYFALRDYGTPDQIGQEDSPEDFVDALIQVFSEVRRVLKNQGTCWINLGDSYAGTSKPGGGDPTIGKRNLGGSDYKKKKLTGDLKVKDLIGIPWMVAFALRSTGWYLRQDIIWSKPNPMPESVTDRCTKSHEYIFLLSKSQTYYYDYKAIKTPIKESLVSRLSQNVAAQIGSQRVPGKINGNMKAVNNGETANKRSVWQVATVPFSDAHFATFPERLIVDCIKAGCPEEGIVLDPFMGAGTTALVAVKLGRKYIGIELNPVYIAIANKRLKDNLGMFNPAQA